MALLMGPIAIMLSPLVANADGADIITSTITAITANNRFILFILLFQFTFQNLFDTPAVKSYLLRIRFKNSDAGARRSTLVFIIADYKGILLAPIERAGEI